MIRSSLHKPAFMYEQSFKPSELEKVKLHQDYNDGTRRTDNCPIFTGAEGVEGLLYVKERFDNSCGILTFDTGVEKFDNFARLLTNNAEQHWTNLTMGIVAGNRSLARFDMEFRRFTLRYSTNHARDHMMQYLRTEAVRKPHNVEVPHHIERLSTMI